ncbi:MAG: response regulator [Deltaproteobacteria bacterium]|nr:response regulator [Deltaproteobacteria bacterium]MBW1848193.1 response regulator [Deltaproteobacteria bacterium]
MQNGEDALEFIEKSNPDITFLDIHMPDLSSMEISENLDSQQKLFPLFHTNVVFISFSRQLVSEREGQLV